MTSENQSSCRRRAFIKSSSAIAAGAALAGCSEDIGEDGSSTDDGQPIINIPNLGYDGEVIHTSRDPGFYSAALETTNALSNAVYDSLLQESPENELIPHIVTEWEFLDPLTLEMEIRDDVTFHSGNHLTAEDIQYTIERIMGLEGAAASVFDGVLTTDSVTVEDDYSVIVELEQQFPTILDSFVTTFVVDSELVREEEVEGDWGQGYLESDTAGSGAYEVVEFERNSVVRLERNEEWWGEWPENPIEQAQWQPIEEDSTIVEMFERNEGHVTRYDLEPETYEQLDARDDTRVVTQSALANWFHHFNASKPPFDDRYVRKAFTLACDHDAAQQIVGPGSMKAAGPVPRNVPGHNDDLEPHSQDLDAAKEALDNAEYTIDEINDMEVTFYKYRNSGPIDRFPIMMQSELEELNIETQISETTWATLTDAATNPDESFELWGGNYDVPGAPLSPDGFTYQAHHPSFMGESFYAANYFTSEELTQVLESARAQTEWEESMEYYKEAQQILYDEYAMLWVSNPGRQFAVREEIQNFSPRGTGGYEFNFREWSWEE